MKVLIVDDSKITRRLMKIMLLSCGCTCIEAHSGEQGIQRLERDQSIDIALIDWRMPEMCGIEFVRRARQLPSSQRTKLLMVTASDIPRDIQRARSEGIDDFIVKPISLQLISAKLKEHGPN